MQKKDSREKKRKFGLATRLFILLSVHLSNYPSVYPPVYLSVHPCFPLPCNIVDHDLWPLRPAGHPRGERVRWWAQLMPCPPQLANDQWLTTNDWKSRRRWCNFLLDKDAHSWTSDCCCMGGWRPVWTMWPVYIIRSAGALNSMPEWACTFEYGRGFLLPCWVSHSFTPHYMTQKSVWIWRAAVNSCQVECSRFAGDKKGGLWIGRDLKTQTAVCCYMF